MKRILLWTTARLPAREICGDHGEPYLERYYLFSLFGWRAYIHRFLASDPDRGLHDHPWGRSVSLMLAGGYFEQRILPHEFCGVRLVGLRLLSPGGFNVIRGDDFHRILLGPGQEAWTLFVHGPRVKGWGFLRDGVYSAFATDKDDYPQQKWWKTAQSGRELRTEQWRRIVLAAERNGSL